MQHWSWKECIEKWKNNTKSRIIRGLLKISKKGTFKCACCAYSKKILFFRCPPMGICGLLSTSLPLTSLLINAQPDLRAPTSEGVSSLLPSFANLFFCAKVSWSLFFALQLILRSKKIRNRANICGKAKQMHKRSRILFFDTSPPPPHTHNDHRSVSEAQSLLREKPNFFLKKEPWIVQKKCFRYFFLFLQFSRN